MERYVTSGPGVSPSQLLSVTPSGFTRNLRRGGGGGGRPHQLQPSALGLLARP
jgi:hypothetical protein